MNQHLILCRHGNTFAPGDTVVWVGARNDLPLVESGIRQAHNLVEACLANGITAEAIYCGPLKRTRQYAEIVRIGLKLTSPVIVDKRLDELDYGEWSGLTERQIIEKFGHEDFENWTKHSLWPKGGSWGSSESQIVSETASFVEDLRSKHTRTSNLLAVSSNGRLRYFLKLLPEFYRSYSQENKLKVGTGNICVLANHLDDNRPGLELICWNTAPAQLRLHLR